MLLAAAALLAGPAAAPALQAQSGAAHALWVAPDLAPAPVSASPTQQTALAQAEQAGLALTRSPAQRAPIAIRGDDLGRRQAFSGGRGLRVRAGASARDNAVAVLDNLANLYQLRDAAQEFRARLVQRDARGFTHVRLRQTHAGLRVIGGELIVHFNGRGVPYEVNGTYVGAISLDTAATLTATAALARAQADFATLELATTGLAAPGGAELVILAQGMQPRLAYAVALHAPQAHGATRWRYAVDAHDGRVLLRYNDTHTIAAPTTNGVPFALTGDLLAGEGGAATAVEGWSEQLGAYYLYSPARAWLVHNVGTGWPDAQTYAHRPSHVWGASDTAEFSAAVNIDHTQRYFRDVHQRASYDDASAIAYVHVHEGIDLVNAYWDGAIHFGDGDGAIAGPLGVNDICAHEFAHAVTAGSAGLYYFRESGALNESFSDIFGACVEFHTQPDGRDLYPDSKPGNADWLCGEDSWLVTPALRDMRNPANPATVGAGGRQPARYRGTHWYGGLGDNGGVHINSGVQNFFFYLLCEGGQGTNDGIAYGLTGIGITNAEQVAYRALTVYCTPYTDYRAVRAAWISAARDLNPAWVPAVESAWAAVGLGSLQAIPGEGLRVLGPAGGPFEPLSLLLTNCGATAVQWQLTASPTWITVTPASGTLPVGGLLALPVAVNALANGFTNGLYAGGLTFSNSLDTATLYQPVQLHVGGRDDFTERFDDMPNDLAFRTLTFIPNESPSFYAAHTDPAVSFPVDPAGNPHLALTDDSFIELALQDNAEVQLYGRSYKRLFVGSNGHITFEHGEAWPEPIMENHFGQPRISGMCVDLYPFSDPGSTRFVCWTQLEDRVAVTFSNIREFWTQGENSFQFELFFDGKIRLTYLNLGVLDGVVGLSRGGGMPAGFQDSDLSAYGPAPAPDALAARPYGGMRTEGYTRGPFMPTATAYTLTNGGPAALTWAAVNTQSWVSVVPSGGTLAAGATAGVTLALRAQVTNFAPGLYRAPVAFSNATTGAKFLRIVELGVHARPPPPVTPFAPDPPDGAAPVLPDATLRWNASPAFDFNNPTRHVVRLGTAPGALAVIATDLTNTTCGPGPLALGQTYYWQVSSSNVEGEAAGPLWHFTVARDVVRFAAPVFTNSEGSAAAELRVTRRGALAGTFVDYVVSNGTALAGEDYRAAAGRLEFAAGQSTNVIRVDLIDDDIPENDETLLAELRSPSPDLVLDLPVGAVVTVKDDDGESINLPFNLRDSANYLWDVDRNGSIFGNDGIGDAYDGGHVLQSFPTFTKAWVRHGREVFVGPSLSGDVEIWRRIYVPTNQAFARFLEVVRNTGATPVTHDLRFLSDLGSDGDTVLVGTSDDVPAGPTNGFTAADNWVVSDDADDAGDPTILHVVANDAGMQRPLAANHTGQFITYEYRLQLQPGETRIVMHFGAQSTNRELARAKGQALEHLDLGALAGLTAEDLARIVNFGIPNAMRVAGGALFATGYVSRAFSPTGTQYRVSNGGATQLAWSVTCAADWLTVTPGGGTLAAGATNLVDAFLNTNAALLAAGTHEATILFSNATDGTTFARTATLTARELPAAPPVPYNPGPPDGADVFAGFGFLTWNEDNDSTLRDTYYTVRFGLSPTTMTAIQTNTPLERYQLFGDYGRTYYWQVAASNASGEALGPLWQFSTYSNAYAFGARSYAADERAGIAFITVQRENTAGPAAVGYATSDGSARAGEDYLPAAGMLTFIPGQAVAEFAVPILDDTLGEDLETVRLALIAPPGSVLGTPSNVVLSLLDNELATANLPLDLYDGSNFLWDVNTDGSIIGRDTLGDAYDYGHVLAGFPTRATAQLVNGREVVLGSEPATDPMLEISRRIYVPASQAFARFLDVVRNTGTVARTFNVQIRSNLGSDLQTVLVATSSGGSAFTTNDNWVVTDDADRAGDPAITHVVANSRARLRPYFAERAGEDVRYSYALDLQPGETQCVLHFGVQSVDRATARATAQALERPGWDALAGIPPEELLRVVNVGFQDTLFVGDTALEASGLVEGPFTPTNAPLLVANVGITSLTWSVVSTSAWITVAPPSGTLSPASSNLVTVSLTAAASALGPGTNTTFLSFSNALSGEIQTREVRVLVGPRLVHRFEFSAIAPTQYVAVPFPVTIRGLDDGGRVATNFNGFISLGLAGPDGAPNYRVVLPGTAGPFVSGIWTGMVACLVPAPLTRLVQDVDDQEGAEDRAPGSSDKFTVLQGLHTLYVKSGWDTGRAIPPYADWSTAALTIQDAVDAALPGSLILVADGEYDAGGRAGYPAGSQLTNIVALYKPVTVRSARREGHVRIGREDYGTPSRCVYVGPGAVLEGFALVDGATLATNGPDGQGAGAWCDGTNALLVNCVLLRNEAAEHGGGVYGGTLRNCKIYANVAGQFGGGAYGSTLINCTVTTNRAHAAGGVYGGSLRNSIVIYNNAVIAPNHLASSFDYSLTWPMPLTGQHNRSGDPGFTVFELWGYWLRLDSTCRDAGDNTAVVGATDLDGHPRIVGSAVDLGAYEYGAAFSHSDRDGIPDGWELDHQLDPTNAADADADADADGQSNYGEYVADTDPRDAQSHFRIENMQIEDATNFFTIDVTFMAASNRTYFVTWKRGQIELADWAWEWGGGTNATAAGMQTLTTQVEPGTGYVRVRVDLTDEDDD